MDPWGLSASDGKGKTGFASELDAVKDFAMIYNPLSIRSNREYGSTIYSYHDEKLDKKMYGYTEPNIGQYLNDKNNKGVSPSRPTNKKYVEVSFIHTHGPYKKTDTTSAAQHDYNIPSPADQSFAKKTGKTVYTVGPAGGVNKFDPTIHKPSVFRPGEFINETWNYIPKDPRDVQNPSNTNTVDISE